MKTITNLNINTLSIMTTGELANTNIEGDKSLSIRLDKDQHKRLKILALSLETSMSELVRAFLVQLIDQYRKENVIDNESEKQD